MQWVTKVKLTQIFCIGMLLFSWISNCCAQNLTIQNKVTLTYKDFANNSYSTESNLVTTPLREVIDLWVIKRGPTDIIPGKIATYTITYGNRGDKTAYGVILADQFPMQMDMLIYQNSGYFLNFNPITKYGTWNIDILPPGTYSFNLSLRTNRKMLGSTTIYNTMNIKSPTTEIYYLNNYSTTATHVRIPEIDLWVQKQGPEFAIPKGYATYTITYGNYGSETAKNVILIDKFSDQIETISTQTSRFLFTWDNLTKCGRWNLGDVAPGTYSFKLVAKIKGDIQCPATITNTIKITYPEAETTEVNNQATITTQITDVDLEITKYGPYEVVQGEEFEYRIILRNISNSIAENVKITDILPQGLVYVGSDITPATITNNIITWEMGNLPARYYRSFNLRVKINDNIPVSSTITNITEISSTNLDSNYTNNRASWTTHICLPKPSLEIRKWQRENKVTAGQKMDYFVRYSNNGKGQAINCIITDYLPVGVSYLWDDSGLPHTITTGNKIIWNVGTINPNTTKDFKLTVQVAKDIQASTTLTNVIEITSPSYESKDRWTCTTHVLEPITDVLIYKWGPDEVLYGTEFNYEITYTNNSASKADDVVIKKVLDPQLSYISDTSKIVPTRNGNEISWYIGTMNPWTSGNFSLKVRVPQSVQTPSTLTNIIEIITPTRENNYNNNRVTTTTRVDRPKVDVGIKKIGSDARPGFIKKYDVTYYNNGTDKAQDVVIIDRLPNEVQYLSSNPAGDYDSVNHTLTWRIGELLPQTKKYITIEVRIPVTQPHGVNLYNYIEITTTSPEYDYTNNNYTEIEPVVTSIDPNDKLVSPQRYIQDNELLNYTIRFENMATATASAILITIEDKLDANLDWTTMKFGEIKIGQETYTLENFNKGSLSCSYDISSGTIRWEFDFKTGANGLPPNVVPPEGEGQVSFSIRAKQGLPAGTEITNTATIIFDYNKPIETPPVINIIDLDKPSSRVNPLNPYQTATTFVVNWSGTDTAGHKPGEIESYTVYVSENGGTFTIWLKNTLNTSATFTGKTGHSYAFYSVAKDRAGNIEDKTPTPEANTILILPLHFVLATLTTTKMYVGQTLPLTVSIYDKEGNPVDYFGTATLRDKLGFVGTAIFNGTNTWSGTITIWQMPNGGTNTVTVEAPGISPATSIPFLVLIDRYVGGTVTLWTPDVGTTTVRFGTSTFIQDFYVIINCVSPKGIIPEGAVVVSAREITAYNMVHAKLTGTFTTMAYIEIPYPDIDQNKLVDGTMIDENSLRMYIWENNQWKEIEDCGVDVDKNIVWCYINHLSTFMPIGILVAPAKLGNVAVYPNPFKPNSGLGHEYITFGSKQNIDRRLTKYATIKIFTVSGELVRTLEVTPQDNGQKIWDARNEFGKEVASGIYIYLITNPQGEKCIGKLAIIR